MSKTYIKEIGEVPNIFNLMWLFDECNQNYFGGMLPTPNIEIIDTTKKLGYFTALFDRYGNLREPKIQISGRYEFSEKRLKDVLVHEMIHYYLAYIKADIRLTHGNAFICMANELNRNYNLNITETYDVSDMVKIKKENWFTKLFS